MREEIEICSEWVNLDDLVVQMMNRGSFLPISNGSKRGWYSKW